MAMAVAVALPTRDDELFRDMLETLQTVNHGDGRIMGFA
jgi:hypothetical protein